MKTLIVIDMQNDFIYGALGTPEAQAIVPKVKKKIEEYRKRGDHIIFTKDSHYDSYLLTLEGKHLPVKHCILDTEGWEIIPGLTCASDRCVRKYGFGYDEWDDAIHELDFAESFELVGVCTDVCVVSNALILKSYYRHTEITVDASCCAGTTPENHKAALQVMKCCQINVVGE